MRIGVGMLLFTSVLIGSLVLAEPQRRDFRHIDGSLGSSSYFESSPVRLSGDLDSLFLIYKHRIRCEDENYFPWAESWDGYNVRIRVAGADTLYEEIEPYQVADDSSYYAPLSRYTHQWDVLRCWEAHGEQMGPYDSPRDQWIGGFSNDEEDSVETKIFDLRPFAGDTIQICFVGGSDWAVCTADSSDFFGYIIDDILVVEGVDSTRLADLPSPLGGDTLFFDDFEGPYQTWSCYNKYPIGDHWWLASGGHSGSYKAMCSNDSTLEYVALMDNAIISPKFAREDLPGWPAGPDSLWLHWWLKGSVDSVNAWAYNMYKLDVGGWEHVSTLHSPYEEKGYDLDSLTNDQWKLNREWSAYGIGMHDLTPLLSAGWDTLQVLVGFGSNASAVPPGVIGLQADDIALIGKQTGEDTLLYFSAEDPGWNDEITGQPWTTVDFTDSLADSMWHKDTFQAISGTYSMWWGDPDIQGYGNGRYQALISPKLYIGYDTGSIAGTVSNGGKGPIAGAVVTAEGALMISDTTDAGGQYLIADVPAGLYDITASASGYYPETEGGATVAEGDTTVVDFYLSPYQMDLDWSTFLGGNSEDYGRGVALDSSGCVYLTGTTRSPDFPVTAGAYDTTLGGVRDAFAAKLNASGSVLIYAIYLGGEGWDYGADIDLDSAGCVYLVGTTQSSDFPITTGAFDSTLGGDKDNFVAKLNTEGDALLYSTYLGGGNNEQDGDIVVDHLGRAHVTANTASSNFPTTPGAFDESFNYGLSDIVVVVLNATGSALYYGTYVGSDGFEKSAGIAIDDSGRTWVAGYTTSSDFPITPNALDNSFNDGDGDAVVFAMDVDGSDMSYGTFLGGGEGDYGTAVKQNDSGQICVAGYTYSDDFPVTPGAFDELHSGDADAFVARLDVSLTSLEFSTYLGGSGSDALWGMGMDANNDIYVMGSTWSQDMPVTDAAVDTTYNGQMDIYLSWLGDDGAVLRYATFLGADFDDSPSDMVVDPQGSAYVIGWTTSSAFPTTAGAFSTVYNGGYCDAFVFKLGGGSDLTPPEAIDDLDISLEGGAKSSSGNVRLIWSEPYDDVGVVRYVIHRSNDPASSGDSIAGTTDTTYVDAGAVGDTLTNYFYVVRAVDGADRKSADSNQVGEFDNQMTNGIE